MMKQVILENQRTSEAVEFVFRLIEQEKGKLFDS